MKTDLSSNKQWQCLYISAYTIIVQRAAIWSLPNPTIRVYGFH